MGEYTKTVRKISRDIEEIKAVLQAKLGIKMPTCTVISSFANQEFVLKEVKRLEDTYEVEIRLPTREWMDRMTKLMGGTSGHFEDNKKCVFKRIHIETYLRAVREADFVHVLNAKVVGSFNEVPEELRTSKRCRAVCAAGHSEKPLTYEYEYYGKNTMLEIGYAHALGKMLTSYLPPTEPELRFLISMQI